MKRKLLAIGLLFVFLALVLFAFREYLTLDKLVAHEEQLRRMVANNPLVAVFVGSVLYVLLSLIPGTAGKSVVYGWLFGFWWAIIQVNVGLTIAALATFYFSRYLFRDAIQSRFGYRLYRLNNALRRDGPYFLLTLRLLHAPYTFVNYAMGTTPLRARTFWWASQVGMLPGNILFVLAGTQLPTLKRLAEDGVHSVFTPQVVIAFILLALLPLIARWGLRRFFPQIEKDADLS
jgi:uncharacterized membrane protein YdjX (TVP38/TMEM64 family)